MSEGQEDRSDDHVKLLKEIRDILIQQSKQADAQWAKYDEHWEAQLRDNRQTKLGCFTSVAALALIAAIILIGRLISN